MNIPYFLILLFPSILDADAVVLDLGLRLEDIASTFPNADLIASADIRMGLINTGFLLMRNTAWLRKFLDQWWSIADRDHVCDQDAFDMLYEQYIRDEKHLQSTDCSIRSKVVVLPMHAMNSHPPAMLYQESHHQVLHLMGESTEMRSIVFHSAFEEICTARSGTVLAPQLGITKKLLLKTAR